MSRPRLLTRTSASNPAGAAPLRRSLRSRQVLAGAIPKPPRALFRSPFDLACRSADLWRSAASGAAAGLSLPRRSRSGRARLTKSRLRSSDMRQEPPGPPLRLAHLTIRQHRVVLEGAHGAHPLPCERAPDSNRATRRVTHLAVMKRRCVQERTRRARPFRNAPASDHSRRQRPFRLSTPFVMLPPPFHASIRPRARSRTRAPART